VCVCVCACVCVCVKCTLNECSGDSLSNRDRVDNFSRQLHLLTGGHSHPVTCFYDPWDVKSGAVLTANVHGWPVFHAIVWPFACAVLGVLVCVGFCHRCHRMTTKQTAATAVSTSDDMTSYAVAARALLHAQKRRKHRSIRNLWMMQQNIWTRDSFETHSPLITCYLHTKLPRKKQSSIRNSQVLSALVMP